MKALLRAGLTAATIGLAISSAHALPVCAPMDFDGDCKSDVLWRNSATGEDYLWLMNGRTIATGGYLRTVGDPAWQIVGTGDFDGDGKADILWRNAVTGQNYIYLMNGLTIASEGSVNVVDPTSGWQVQGIGDFDGDGRDDVLWRNLATGENYIWLMNGWTIASGGLIRTVADQAWQVKGIGDFDGDGKADILWRNTVTGEDYAYFMNGPAIASEGFLNTVADQYWMPKSATTLADVTGWDTVAPSTPAGLTASAVSSSRINLSWLAATDNVGVIRYGVYRNGVQIDIVAATSYANTGLAAATTYSYTVLAYDTSWNASAQSSAVSATTKALADTQAPSIPANLAATAVSSSQIDLSWSPATDNVGVTGYAVYRNGTLAASPSGTSASITGLSASTTYSFTVSAFDAAGNVSALSAPLSVTTPVSTLPQIQWSAGMQTGDLSQWSEKVNSGSADTTVVTPASLGIPPRSGSSYVMKQAVTAVPGGTRMQRYPEVDALFRAGTKFYWTWWDYFPTAVSFSASQMYQIWGAMSMPSSVQFSDADIFFSLGFTPSGNML